MEHAIIEEELSRELESAPQDRIIQHFLFGKQLKAAEHFLFGKQPIAAILEREKCQGKKALGHGDIWFTGTGFGICGLRKRLDSTNRLTYYTVIQAEMAAIEKCAKDLVQKKVRGRVIKICTDSQAALRALEKPITI